MKQPLLFVDQTGSWGGAQRVLDGVLGALERDFLPLVALPEDGPFAAELRQRGIETLTLPLGRYRSGRKSLADMIAFPLRSVRCGVRLARIIRRRNIRLVYINGPRCLVAGAFAARLTGTPSLFHLHLMMTRRTEFLVTALAARHVTRIVACCEATAAPLVRRHPDLARILQVIYNPVRKLVSDAALSRQRETPSPPLMNLADPVVGVVGRICPQKGQHIMIRAAARLRRRGRNVRVVFLGATNENSPEDTAYARLLESSARQLDLEGRIEWPGYQADPNPYYAAFNVLVIPSTVSEGLPLAALEAMQWGIPVVGSRIGGIPEVVREEVNGLLVPPGDDEALARSLERVLDDRALRSRLGAAARASIDSRFSIETFGSSICSVVSQLCKPEGTLVEEPVLPTVALNLGPGRSAPRTEKEAGRLGR
jgi:glycosyltransferase involved in cell wall biosynthesis